MKRRQFMQVNAALGLVGLHSIAGGDARASAKIGAANSIIEASVVELQTAMTSEKLDSQSLVKLYLTLIKAIDQSGPKINAIIELNPDALTIAATFEQAAKQRRAPLYLKSVALK